MKIEKCDRLEYLFASSVARNITQLQQIEVTDCKNLKEIFGEESKDRGDEIETNDKIDFNQLCSLTLQRLPQFIKIGSDMRVVFPRLENLKLCSITIENTWLDQPLTMSSYSQCLKSLTVEECNGLKFLFSSSMVRSLNQLHKLVIGNCKSMEVIIDSKGEEGEERIIDMSFPKLFYLKLEVLPKLVTFGIGNSIEFPSLNELHIDGCSNLKTFFCKSFSPGTVREEPKEELNWENYFIDINPLFDEKVAFPSLEVMVLLHLDNLQLIWNNQQLHVESFCKLKEVIPNLEVLGLDAHDFKLTFLHCDLAKSFDKLKELFLGNFDDESVASLSGFLQRLNCLESLLFYDSSFKDLFPYEQGHIWKQDLQGDTFLQNLQTL
ncbi:uncharacterized protein LOC116112566 [Pistacia vera]|uniref:uncharacterized protein LOC116112566 n=1 Tax=Pistacia vera TaxID=55513 RepID=UPI0012634886|nr:uncharacterized protein LOC116112566 [Pistacia vera]